MKTFVFLLKKKWKNDLNEKLLLEHVEYLKNLKKTANLIICGPFFDNDGAMQIILANTREEAILLFEQDPFIRYKYYEEYVIHELLEANESNNWLMNNP